MPSYLITGASRGIGFAFLDNLSSDPKNTVIGLVRNVPGTEAKIAAWNRTNIHLVQGDIDSYSSLSAAATSTSKITDGKLDYLIANAALLPVSEGDSWSNFDSFSTKGQQPQKLEDELFSQFRTNVVGQIHLINVFLPLILKGDAKKVIVISSGNADVELVNKYNLHESGSYSISKAAVNMAIAKFNAEFAKDGVLFVGICPGFVDTGHFNDMSEADGKKLMEMVGKFKAYSPNSSGTSSPADSVKDVLNVVEQVSVAKGHGGAFLSHLYPSKMWI